MGRPYGTFTLNPIKKVQSEGIAYIYANNSSAKATVNLDEDLLTEISKRTWTHNRTRNYFVNSSENEYLHSFIMAYYLGKTDIVEGRKILKEHIEKDYQVDHFLNTNRTEEEAKTDCRIENLHLVLQGQNKANYSIYCFAPYEFHSVMHKGYFASYMTDGIYEAYKNYDDFTEYLTDRNYFYSNGLIKFLKEKIRYFTEETQSNYRDCELASIKEIIRNGNIKAEANHKASIELLKEYDITLCENETRLLPDGHIISNVENSISPYKLEKLQSDFIVINDNPTIKQQLIKNIECMYC